MKWIKDFSIYCLIPTWLLTLQPVLKLDGWRDLKGLGDFGDKYEKRVEAREAKAAAKLAKIKSNAEAANEKSESEENEDSESDETDSKTDSKADSKKATDDEDKKWVVQTPWSVKRPIVGLNLLELYYRQLFSLLFYYSRDTS